MAVYGQQQVTQAMAPKPGPMAGLGGSYTAARQAAEQKPSNALQGIQVQQPMGPVQPQQPQGYGIGRSLMTNGGVNRAPGVRETVQTQPSAGGVVAGYGGGPANQPQNVPSLADIQAEMQRRQVGQQLNANPANSALAGYMMGQ